MKKIISVVVIMFIVCALLVSCGSDYISSVKAELVGTWMKESTSYATGYTEYTDFYVFYPTGRFRYVMVIESYNSSGHLIGGEPYVGEHHGTYEITENMIITTWDDEDTWDGTNEYSYLWNDKSGKITQLGSDFVKLSNSTNYLNK